MQKINVKNENFEKKRASDHRDKIYSQSLDEKKYFDGEYEKLLKENKEGWGSQQMYIAKRDRLCWFLEEVQVSKNIDILEIGCGMGNMLEIIDSMGFKNSAGMDISETAIQYAKNKLMNKDILLICADLSQQNVLPEDKFDLVFDTDCIHMITDLPRTEMWQNIYSTLKKGGYFLTGNNCSPASVNYFKEFNGRREYYWPDNETFVSEVESNGFVLLSKRILKRRNNQCDSWNEYIFQK